MIWQILSSLPRTAISVFGLVWAIRGRRQHPRISWAVGAVCVLDLAMVIFWLLRIREWQIGLDLAFFWTCLDWLKILVLVAATFAERDESPPARPHEP